MFIIECGECGVKDKIVRGNWGIDTVEDIIIASGEGTIDYIKCGECGHTIFDNDDIEKRVKGE